LLGLLFSDRGSQNVFRKQTNFFNLMENFLILNFSNLETEHIWYYDMFSKEFKRLRGILKSLRDWEMKSDLADKGIEA
jgi:hypothetical protein